MFYELCYVYACIYVTIWLLHELCSLFGENKYVHYIYNTFLFLSCKKSNHLSCPFIASCQSLQSAVETMPFIYLCFPDHFIQFSFFSFAQPCGQKHLWLPDCCSYFNAPTVMLSESTRAHCAVLPWEQICPALLFLFFLFLLKQKE